MKLISAIAILLLSTHMSLANTGDWQDDDGDWHNGETGVEYPDQDKDEPTTPTTPETPVSVRPETGGEGQPMSKAGCVTCCRDGNKAVHRYVIGTPEGERLQSRAECIGLAKADFQALPKCHP